MKGRGNFHWQKNWQTNTVFPVTNISNVCLQIKVGLTSTKCSYGLKNSMERIKMYEVILLWKCIPDTQQNIWRCIVGVQTTGKDDMCIKKWSLMSHTSKTGQTFVYTVWHDTIWGSLVYSSRSPWPSSAYVAGALWRRCTRLQIMSPTCSMGGKVRTLHSGGVLLPEVVSYVTFTVNTSIIVLGDKTLTSMAHKRLTTFRASMLPL